MENLYLILKDYLKKKEEHARKNGNLENFNVLDEIKEKIDEEKEILESITSKDLDKSMLRLAFLNQDQNFYDPYFENTKNNIFNLIKLLKNIKELLKFLTVPEKSIILIGGNGSGKSSLADYLKNNISEEVLIFPAYKNLLLGDHGDTFYNSKYIQDIQSSVAAKRNNINYNNRDENILKNSIVAIINEHLKELQKKHEEKSNQEPITMFDKFREIYYQIFPELEINIDTDRRIMYPKKNNQDYIFNLMSEGEKVVILYIIEVLLAKESSYIIIDEPESHLNLAIVNKLWDMLIEERKDCHFIFISHHIDFITSRNNSELVWCKSFNYPDEWKLEKISNIDNLPTELTVQLIGTKKPVILCEGDKSNSLDYKVYSQLFIEDYSIYPVGGHLEVIRYVKGFSNFLFPTKVYGIIDGDLIEENRIEEYKDQNIIVLPFNEVEMFLLEEEIIKNVLTYSEEKITQKIESFKNKLVEKIENNKEKIVLSKIKKEIDLSFKEKNIENFNSLNDLKEDYKNIFDLELVDKKHSKYMNELENILAQKNYMELLKWCSLKKEISKGLANQELDNDYVEKAINMISRNKSLREKLKRKYFSTFVK
jgi:hypothetical protein